MRNKTEGKKIWVHLFLYLITTFLAFGLSNLCYNHNFWMDGKSYPSLLVASLIATLVTYFISRQNLINVTTQIPQLVWKIIEFFFLFTFFVLIYWFSVNSIHYSKYQITLFFLLYFLLLLVFNFIYIRKLRDIRHEISRVNTLVVGENKFSNQFIESLKTNTWMGFQFLAKKSQQDLKKIDLKEYITNKKVKAVFINWDEYAQNSESELHFRNIAEEKGVKFYIISEVFATKLIPSTYSLVGSFPYLSLHQFPLDNAFNKTLKRLFDIFFSLMFFVFIASWIFPIIIIVNIIDSGIPVFFTQKRHGMDNKVFDCLKFRSMVVNKDSNDKITVKNDPRITRFGRILRKTSLDEFPQFWNVLKGDMSIVGPRPHMVNQNRHYDQIISKYSFRHYVKPGITGLAQVNGFRGEIKRDEDMQNRVQSDLYYIRNWSFGLDLLIIYRTVANMIRGDENAI